MSVIGLGIDVCDVARFTRAVDRTPRLAERLFTDAERALADGRPRTTRSLAGRFAAKEAAMKALGATEGIGWREIEVVQGADGDPTIRLAGRATEVATRRGVRAVHVSMSHDRGQAVAVVVIED